MILKSFFWQIINILIKTFLELFVFDKKIRRILKGNWAKFYLHKYINNAVKQEYKDEKTSKISRQIIWQYWESSDKKIPPLVQACLNSVEKHKGEWERIILTPENFNEYVEVPEIIINLKKKGIIKTAFFSDILRTCLLIQNGGIWIDATILLTQNIPSYIKNADLFVFQNDIKTDLDGLNMASYFIASKANNKILKQTLAALLEYWKENKFLINYFTFLHTFTMITQSTPNNKELFERIPFFSFIPVQQLQKELLTQFSPKRWLEIKQTSWIHKLTHKKNVLTKQKELNIDGTFYEYIIKEFGDK